MSEIVLFQGYYACVVGTDLAHIQHVARLELLEPSMTPTQALSNQRLQALAISISIFALLLIVAIVLIWRRFQREKLKKQQVTISTMSCLDLS